MSGNSTHSARKGLVPDNPLAYNARIMNGLALEKIHTGSLELALGPLTYRLVAHDAWGEQVLAELGLHLETAHRPCHRPDRIIHLCSLHQGPDNCKEERALPEPLLSWLPASDRDRRWSYRRNLVNTVWSATGSKHSFWTAGIDTSLGSFRYHLPWDLLLHDMQAHGGGLIHGGLVEHEGSALLLLAPPGGGKTTTLATAPASWQVLSDDAALLWPLDKECWQASPLPSWGVLNRTTTGPTAKLRKLDRPAPVRVLVRLFQSEELRLNALSPVDTVPLIYRALCEYPAAFLADPGFRVHFFHISAALARQTPCWRLDLPLHAAVWSRLATLLERPQT